MRYLISNGYAYQIDGEVAYKVTFDELENMTISKDDKIENISNYDTFSYYEIYRKLNVHNNCLMMRLEQEKQEIVEPEIQVETKVVKPKNKKNK